MKTYPEDQVIEESKYTLVYLFVDFKKKNEGYMFMDGEGSSGECDTVLMVIKISYISRKLHEMVDMW